MHTQPATPHDPFYRIVAGVALAIVATLVVLTPEPAAESAEAPAVVTTSADAA